MNNLTNWKRLNELFFLGYMSVPRITGRGCTTDTKVPRWRTQRYAAFVGTKSFMNFWINNWLLY